MNGATARRAKSTNRTMRLRRKRSANAPRYQLFKGGEGGGKSVAGIVKTLNRIKCGMSGALCSPDLPHFKKSLWPEFQRWCPWQMVVPSQRYRGAFEWSPYAPFELAFVNGAKLYCGGIEEPMAWEGGNISFAHLDEARRMKDAAALKVLDGRVRIAGADGTPPQLWITTTPRKNWLFEYFGPMLTDDPRAAFKHDSQVVTLFTSDNERDGNLATGYSSQKAANTYRVRGARSSGGRMGRHRGGRPILALNGLVGHVERAIAARHAPRADGAGNGCGDRQSGNRIRLFWDCRRDSASNTP